MFAESFHGNCVNCDASTQRQRLYYSRGPFVFSFNVSQQLYFLTDTLSTHFLQIFFLTECLSWLYWVQTSFKNNNEWFIFGNMESLKSHYLNYLFVSDKDAIVNGRTGYEKNHLQAILLLHFPILFSASVVQVEPTVWGHHSLALVEKFWMLVSSLKCEPLQCCSLCFDCSCCLDTTNINFQIHLLQCLFTFQEMLLPWAQILLIIKGNMNVGSLIWFPRFPLDGPCLQNCTQYPHSFVKLNYNGSCCFYFIFHFFCPSWVLPWCLGSCHASARSPGSCMMLISCSKKRRSSVIAVSVHVLIPITYLLNLLAALSQAWYKCRE